MTKKEIKANENFTFVNNKEEAERIIIQEEKKEAKEYRLMFSIEPYLEDYFKNIRFMTQQSFKDYVNGLIKKDMIQRIGATEDCSEEELLQKWNEYKENIHKIFNIKL